MKETEKINRLISLILKISSILSMILMIAGFALFLISPEQIPRGTAALPFRVALTGALHLEPLGLMTLGIIILISTPFLRVTGAFFSFMVFERDRVYGLISLGVLAILIIGLFIPGIRH